MEDFFTSFFDNDMTTPDAGVYSLSHLLWVVIIIFAVIVSFKALRNHPKGQTVFIKMASIVMLVTTLLGKLAYFYETRNFWYFYPSQLCSLNAILLPIVLLFDLKWAREFSIATSLLGAVVTLAYPTRLFIGDHLTMRLIDGILVHALLVILPLFCILTKRFIPNPKKAYQIAIGILIAAGAAEIVNSINGTNFMYLRENPLPIFLPFSHLYLYAAMIILMISLYYFLTMFGTTRKKNDFEKSNP
ncbi:MAG: hypothetical protein ABII85_05550 [Bacillota bacterium]